MKNMSTKEQEKEALEKIMRIIESVGGDDSYIGMAAKGFYQTAMSNIEYDMAGSLQDAARKAESEAEGYRKQAMSKDQEAKRLQININDMSNHIDHLNHQNDELRAKLIEAEKKQHRTQMDLNMASIQNELDKQKIMELKAKLYDFMSPEQEKKEA